MSVTGTWGSFEVSLPRYGVSRYRLVVNPPGISEHQRRALRSWRSWPLWGAGLWLGVQILGVVTGTGWAALIGGTLLYMAVGALAFAMTGDVRWRVRTVSATSYPGYCHPELTGRHRGLVSLAARMRRAESLLAQGRITAAEYEARWWEVYDALPGTDTRSGQVTGVFRSVAGTRG